MPGTPHNLRLVRGSVPSPTGIESFAFYGFTTGVSIHGPALESMSRYDKVVCGPSGTIYAARGDADWPGIYVIRGGVVDVINLNNRRGYRDNCPASIAKFDPSGQSGYSGSLQIAGDRNTADLLYVVDGYNLKIRKVYKNAGQWWVSTVATIASTSKAITVDPSGNIWVCMINQLIKVSPSGTTLLTYDDSQLGETTDLDSDSAGNIYGLYRAGNYLWRYNTSGVFSILNTINHSYWDGAASACQFNGLGFVAVEPDGSAIYTGGGDEYMVRRIKPIDHDTGQVRTLSNDGSAWLQLSSQQTTGDLMGAPRCMDQSGHLYVAWVIVKPKCLRRLTLPA